MKNLLFVLMLILPLSSFAQGNCSFVAHRHCYEPNAITTFPHAMIRALCLTSSDILEGMLTTQDFNECKLEARNFGQMVEVEYNDFESGKRTSARVYE